MTSILKADEIQDSSGNLIIKEVANAITIGASGDTVTVPAGATLNVAGTLQSGGSAITQGITQAQQWRITANATGAQSPLTANWEKADTDGAGSIGSDMTQSSGVFTFPSTGIWYISFQCSCEGATSNYINVVIQTTTDNASYGSAAEGYNLLPNTSSYMSTTVDFIFDVTNTSNDKVRFTVAPEAGAGITMGDTGNHRTGATFIRLGNT